MVASAERNHELVAHLAPQRPRLIEVVHNHVFAAERIHADDTTVPVLAKGKTRIGRLWTYVRDDRPFAGPDPPAAAFFYSRGQCQARHCWSPRRQSSHRRWRQPVALNEALLGNKRPKLHEFVHRRASSVRTVH